MIKLWLLLLAAEAPNGERLDRGCTPSAWRVAEPQFRCTAQPEPVVLYVPRLTDEELARAWQVARQRYQQTLDKVRLLERSSLGAARARGARQRTSPRAVQEVFKRMREQIAATDRVAPQPPGAPGRTTTAAGTTEAPTTCSHHCSARMPAN